MTNPGGRGTTGDGGLDGHIESILDEIAPEADRDLLGDILVEGVRLASTDTERLDLKIADAALREMRESFAAFAPVRDRRKVTVFGSARTTADDPLYTQARELARLAAEHGWMVVTGAGPGIMLAAMEGAGRENSFGVRIRLPFEDEANEIIAGDPKLVSMKYFFTRKLMLMKESQAYVAMPGGFGTLDETIELLTLQQTGKAPPAPVVLLDIPGGDYWHTWRRFVATQLAEGGYVDHTDLGIAHLCDHETEALTWIEHYYANFRSIRWVGPELIIRLNVAPDRSQLADLNERFGSFALDGRGLRVTGPHRAEVSSGDDLDAARVRIRLDPFRVGRLHQIVGALNDLVAPHVAR